MTTGHRCQASMQAGYLLWALLAAVVGLAGFAVSADAAIAFKQTNNAVPQSPQATVTVAFTAAQTAGGLNVVAIGWFNTTSNILSVTDTRNNTYVLAAGPTTQAKAGRQAIYYAANIVSATAGSNSVTVTFNGAVPYPDVRIAEYSGIDPLNPFDRAASGTGSGTTSNSGTVATTNANDLLVGANYVTSRTTAAGSGYIARVITSPNGSILEDRVVTSTGSYNATATLKSGSWIMQMVAFRAASGGPADTQAPTAPTNLAVSVTSATQINLSWTAATDNVGVTGYQIERCTGAGCTNFALLTNVATTSYSNTGLTAATTYQYRVRATDLAGNLSAYSAVVSGTTPAAPDTQAPTVPANPAASVTSATQINLSWTAATDYVGVTGYQIERCTGAGCTNFALLTTVTTTGYNNTGLTAATNYSYRVRATDLAGNLSAYSVVVSGTTPAAVLIIGPVSAPPREIGAVVNYSASASASGTPPLTYQWSFGDGSPVGGFSTDPTSSHTFLSPGRFDVTVTVRDGLSSVESVTVRQAIYRPHTALAPSADSSIIYESSTGVGRVWAVNPDEDTVTVISDATLSKVAEIGVGDQPVSLALGSDGKIWVVNKRGASITRIDPTTLTVSGTVALPRASQPHGLVFSTTDGLAYLVLEGLGRVVRLSNTTGSVLAAVDVGAHPRHLSVTGDGTQIYVSRFITPSLPGEGTSAPSLVFNGSPVGAEVVVVDGTSLQVVSTIVLEHSNAPATPQSGPGLPNYLRTPLISPDGLSAWVPSKQDNVLGGTLRSGTNLNHDHTVRAVSSQINLATRTQTMRVDHDNASVASAAVFDVSGNYLFVALEGGRQVDVIDAYSGAEVYRFTVGRAPEGLAVSPDGRRVFVDNFMDHTVTVHDVSRLIDEGVGWENRLATIATVSNEALPANVLLGKQLFYDAADGRLASELYLSCASCHNEGGQDGRTWDFTGFGEGLRNTISLLGHAGMAQGPLHWTGNFDEVQDFEGQIRSLAGGIGLMTNAAFNSGTRSQPLGDPKAGVSADLDALAAYVASLSLTPPSPDRLSDGTLTPSGIAGRNVFAVKDCGSCHQGSAFTDSQLNVRHDVGTLTLYSGTRLGAPLDGLDTPTLKGVGATGPYLHDGSRASLEDAVTAHAGVSLTTQDLASLVDYLRQIDDSEPAPSVAPTAPTGLGATVVSSSQINLSWTASTDNVGVTGYRVERCQGTGCTTFVQIATPAGTTFNDTGLTGATSYSYRVRATDAANNLSTYSGTASGTTQAVADTQAPAAPTGLGATVVSSSQINLGWTASTDNVGVTGYQLERCTGTGCTNFALLTTATSTGYNNTGLTAATSYSYRVRATDLASNLSGYSATVSATTPAGPPAAIAFRQINSAVPQSPQTTVSVPFTVAQTAGGLNVVAIGWYDTTSHILSVTDTRNNSYVLAAGPTTQAQAGTQALYYAANIVAATAGSNSVTVTFDAAVPYPDVRIAEYSGIDPVNAVDTGAEATGSGTTSDSGSVTTLNANDLLVGANYVTSRTTAAGSGYTARVITSPDGSILEDRVVTSTGSYNATATLTSGSWIMQMVAFRGGSSGGGGDTQVPTAPTGLGATVVSSSQINLGWTAATDNVGVTGYQIERCTGAGCTNFVILTTATTAGYNNTGLTTATSYSYRVRATDAAGNLSGYSPIATATTQSGDTQPPTVSITSPAGGATLTGTSAITASALDAGGIAGVQFQVDGINVGAPDTTAPYSLSFETTQMANGAHSITAYAWDPQRNVGNSAAVAVTFSNASPANPAQTGFWGGLVQLPLVAIHVNLMPNGRVLTWDQMAFGYPDPVVWDPLTSATTTVPVGDGTNLFCAGHTILPDGRVLVAGGNIANHVGTTTGRIFDLTSNTWSATPDMTQGRWYPNLTTLADGRVLALSGETSCQGCYALIPEIYDPATNSWSELTGAPKSLTWYPNAAQLANGKVVVTGTSEAPSATFTLDLNTQVWSTVDSRVFESGSGVMYAPGKFLKAGTSTDSSSNVASTAVARVLDMNAPTPAWRTITPMAFPRTYHVMTVLPDGNVLVTGGGRTTGQADLANAVYQAELWSPTTETWTTLSSMQAPRLYHGTALLLPDARVLVSGGGRGYGVVAPSDQLSTEIFTPPYLFKGARPTITSVPTQLSYGQAFSVQTPDAATIASVSLISLGSMTHAFNMNQRYLSLAFAAGSGSLSVTAPAGTSITPPGYYMLFVVGTNGVPSVAAIVTL